MNTIERMIISFGITDETFALASLQPGKLTFKFMLGFILTPIIGWVGGTLAGEFIMGLLPLALQGAMGNCLIWYVLSSYCPCNEGFNTSNYSGINFYWSSYTLYLCAII